MGQKSQLEGEDLKSLFPFEASIEEILSLGLEINHIVILDKLLTHEPLPAHPKISAWIQTLERKGYIDKSFNVSDGGYLLLKSLYENKSDIKDSLTVNVASSFEEWWAAYPAADTFIHKGKRFQGTRSLKNSKDKCKALYTAIIKRRKYTPEQLLQALQTEVANKKNQSYKENKNLMTFMKNTHAYLYQEAFEGYIELSKQTPQAEEEAPSGTFSI